MLHRGERAYALTFPTSGPRVTLSGAVSPGGQTGLTLNVVGPTRRWQVRFADTAVASPAEVTRHEATGAQSLPLLFESGRRVTWQRLHQALTGGGRIGYSLDQPLRPWTPPPARSPTTRFATPLRGTDSCRTEDGRLAAHA